MSYFEIHIFGAPAALINLVLLGWMLGMQSAKGPMWHLIVTNCINIVFDVWFVWGLGWGVEGVAIASLIADYSGVVVGGYFVRQLLIKHNITILPESLKVWRHWQTIAPLLLINRDIFLRTLCLSVCFMFMTFKGARLGDDIIAANALLLNLLTLISFALDGVAYAVEALVGKAVGAKNREQLRQSIKDALFWGIIFALGFVLLFAFAGEWLLGLLTDIPNVYSSALVFLPWMVAMPLISMWCYILDGVFIGLTRAKDMRDSTFLAALLGFFLPIAILSHGLWLYEVDGNAQWHNHVLWLAMSGFMLMRGVVLAVKLKREHHRWIK
jgi:MATE family multidrug resistance protein